MAFFVSEIGVNWNGDFELLKNMIFLSKKIGFDAIKLQAFNEENVSNNKHKSKLLECSVNEKNIDEINQITKDVGIEWFCTPMYDEAVDFIDPYVNRYKIREVDGRDLLKNTKTSLFEKIYVKNKEIIISSQTNPLNCKFYNDKKIKWLYTVPKYPCTLSDLNFKEFNCFDGYSNHCPNSLALLTAVILGADIIEIHVTSSKEENFFDNNVSFTFDELKTTFNNFEQIKQMQI